MRNTERGKLAAEDANLSAGGVANAFSSAFGSPITEKDAPQLHKLLTNMIEDAGDTATRSAKEKYMRIRPFAFYGVSTCNTTEQDKLAKNGSYPSGHTSIGWATAPVLAEINPQRQNEILKRGYELGESRVICGYHWQSDVDAARIVGSAVVATLHTNPAFQQQLQKAKDEFAKRRSNVIAVAFPDAAPARLVRATKPRLIRMVGVVGRVRREPPPGIDAAPSLLPSPGGAALARPAGRFLSGRASEEALQCGCLCYLWLQRSLRSRLIVCVMPGMAQGAQGRPVAAAPVPRAPASKIAAARPSTYPCRLRVGPRQRPCKTRPSARIHAGCPGLPGTSQRF